MQSGTVPKRNIKANPPESTITNQLPNKITLLFLYTSYIKIMS